MLCRQVHAGAKQRTFQPRQLANLLWALATLGAREETAVIDTIMEACLDADLRAFKSQEMSNAVWAMATLGVQTPQVPFKQIQCHQTRCSFPLIGFPHTDNCTMSSSMWFITSSMCLWYFRCSNGNPIMSGSVMQACMKCARLPKIKEFPHVHGSGT
jgi:hypothetical protein